MPKISTRQNRLANDELDAPTVEIFGSALALLIIILILVNLIVTQDIRAMLDRSTENAQYKVSWQDGSAGFVVITYPDKLRIIETNQNVHKDRICEAGSPFMQYVENIYQDNQKQLIFAIVEGGVNTMAIARTCMRTRWPDRTISIGWIIASKDLLSTARLQDLPAHIKKSISQ